VAPDTGSPYAGHLEFLYDPERAPALAADLDSLVRRWSGRIVGRTPRPFTQEDVVLITYGDMVQQAGEAPLATLDEFLTSHVADVVNTVHILPFFPYSSDDGFSVIDYHAVDPNLGDWGDVGTLSESFRLMFDAVINHISAQSEWFRGFLADDPRYRDYFTVVDPGTDTSSVFRPRELPLLTEVQTAAGPRHVWTTFSADQIDLNYREPALLLAVLDVLLSYVARGASLIRLDAIAFIWKEVGTPCIHLPQTHRIIQLMRAVLESVAPDVAIVTETNVPHEDNISYFGDGTNEAHMVYNFTLPPLTLHAFHSGDATVLSGWAGGLDTPSSQTTFFNFLASHDGIGVGGARGLLSEADIEAIAARVQRLGGRASYRSHGDGTRSVYELNVNFLDALGDPEARETDLGPTVRRFLTSQAIMLALRGVPGIYFHSLFGSRGWPEGVAETGSARTINRQKLERSALEVELDDPSALRHQVFAGYRELLARRTTHPAFSPDADQHVLTAHPSVFALARVARRTGDVALCFHNVSGQPVTVAADLRVAPFEEPAALRRLVGDAAFRLDGATLTAEIPPYDTLWLSGDSPE
jgi:sucrose phosphorylase